MRRGECGTAYPPADGTYDREAIDRFADFLRMAPKLATKAQVDAGQSRPASPAERYRLKLAVWRCSPYSINLAARLAGGEEWWPDGYGPTP